MLFCGGAAAIMRLSDSRNVKTMGNLCLVLKGGYSNGLNIDTWLLQPDIECLVGDRHQSRSEFFY